MQRRQPIIIRRIALWVADGLEAVVAAERESLEHQYLGAVSQKQMVAALIGVFWFLVLIVLAGLGLNWLAGLWVGVTAAMAVAVFRQFPADLRRELRVAIFRPEAPHQNVAVRWGSRVLLTVLIVFVLAKVAYQFGLISLPFLAGG